MPTDTPSQGCGLLEGSLSSLLGVPEFTVKVLWSWSSPRTASGPADATGGRFYPLSPGSLEEPT